MGRRHRATPPERSLLTVPAGRVAKWVIVAVWLAAAAISGPFAGRLNSVQRNENASFLPRDAESTRALALQERFPGGDTLPLLIVYERPAGTTLADTQTATREITSLIDRYTPESVKRAQAEQSQQQQEQSPQPQEQPQQPSGEQPPGQSGGQQPGGPAGQGPAGPVIPSEDGKALLGVVLLGGGDDGDGERLAATVEDIRAEVGERDDGMTVKVTGPGGFLADFLAVFGEIDTTLLLTTLIVVALLLLAIYRSPFLPVVALSVVGIALSAAMASVYGLVKGIDLTVNGQSNGILTVLTVGAGTDYALLLIARYREELRRHTDKHEAMAIALRNAGPAILASASTVTIGLLCLLVAELNSNRGLGPVGAVGIVAALVAMLTLLPAVLVIFGRRLFWPFVPAPAGRVRSRQDGDPVGAGGSGGERSEPPDQSGTAARVPAAAGLTAPEESGVWARIGQVIGRRPRWTWVLTTAALLVSALGLTALDTDLRGVDAFVGEPDSVAGQKIIQAHYPSGSGQPAVIVARTGEASSVLQAALNTDGVTSVRPSGTVDDLVQFDAVLAAEPDSQEERDTIDRLRTAVHSIPGADALVGGPGAQNLDLARSSTHDRNLVIPLVLLVVLVILAVLLRAIVAPLVLIATVVVSFAAALGVSAVVFDRVFGFAGADASLPLFAFIFLVALGIDYNIFLMSRVREEAERLGTRAGTLKGLAVTGGVITSAGIVLAATFSVLAVLPIVALVEVGFVVAFGVLLDTMVVRSILVPALTLDLDRRMWWPGALSREPVAPAPAAPAAEPMAREPAPAGRGRGNRRRHR